VELLLDDGLSVDELDDESRSALHLAAYNGDTALATVLLKRNARTELRDTEGRTALHWAAYNGFRDFVLQLIDAKCDLDSQDNGGRTSLIYAAHNGHRKVSELLIDSGAGVAIEDNEGKVALDHAVYLEREDVMDILARKMDRNHPSMLALTGDGADADGQKDAAGKDAAAGETPAGETPADNNNNNNSNNSNSNDTGPANDAVFWRKNSDIVSDNVSDNNGASPLGGNGNNDDNDNNDDGTNNNNADAVEAFVMEEFESSVEILSPTSRAQLGGGRGRVSEILVGGGYESPEPRRGPSKFNLPADATPTERPGAAGAGQKEGCTAGCETVIAALRERLDTMSIKCSRSMSDLAGAREETDKIKRQLEDEIERMKMAHAAELSRARKGCVWFSISYDAACDSTMPMLYASVYSQLKTTFITTLSLSPTPSAATSSLDDGGNGAASASSTATSSSSPASSSSPSVAEFEKLKMAAAVTQSALATAKRQGEEQLRAARDTHQKEVARLQSTIQGLRDGDGSGGGVPRAPRAEPGSGEAARVDRDALNAAKLSGVVVVCLGFFFFFFFFF
jgi:hypothetical protein